MIKLKITLFLMTISSIVLSQDHTSKQMQKVTRENTEWCDTWIPYVQKTDKPRILLIGDSIMKGYYKPVCKLLSEKAYCAKFATSACITDPVFYLQLRTMFSQYKYAIIHFNNGLHGFGYTEKEYQAGYEKVLKYLRKVSSSSKIILALSTPLNLKDNKNHLNYRIDERNRIVQELGKKYDVEINDLYSISKNHPEYYKDTYHYKSKGIELQSKQVADAIVRLLQISTAKSQCVSPPLSSECPLGKGMLQDLKQSNPLKTESRRKPE